MSYSDRIKEIGKIIEAEEKATRKHMKLLLKRISRPIIANKEQKMFNDRFWGWRGMRWLAVICYFTGLGLIFLSNNVWLMQIGLILWVLPVWWCAYMYQKPAPK